MSLLDFFRKKKPQNTVVRTIGPTADDGTFFLTNRLLSGRDPFSKPFAQHPWIFSAVNAVAVPFKSSPLRLWRGAEDNATEVTSGPVWELLNAPNADVLPGRMLFEGTIVQQYLTGEGNWLFYRRGRPLASPNEIPDQIFLASRQDIEPVLSKDSQGRSALPIRFWRSTDNSKLEFPTFSVAPHRLFNPYSLLRGLSPLAAALTSARSDFSATLWSQKFFENGAIPGAVITFPVDVEMTTEQMAQYLETWESKHKGPNNAGRMAVLDRGGDLVVFGKAHDDMSWEPLRKLTREDINAVVGVTMFDLGVVDDINRETATETRKRLYDQVIIPRQNAVAAVLNLFIRRWLGPDHFVKFDNSGVEALQEGLSEKLDAGLKLQTLGYNANQINERLMLEMPEIEEPEPEPEPEPDFDDDADRIASVLVTREVDEDETPDGFDKQTRDAKWETIFRQVLRPGEKDFRQKFRRFVGRLRAEQLQRFEEATQGRAIRTLTDQEIEALLFDVDAWQNRLIGSLEPSYQKVAGAALSQLSVDLGREIPERVLEIQALIDTREIHVRGMVDTIKRRLRRVLVAGANADKTVPQIAKSLKRVFNLTTRRAVTIARTETAISANGARFIGMRAEGIHFHQWANSKDEKVRPTHRSPTDGTIVKIGDPFPNGLLYPAQTNGAAREVINCRCVALPVEDEDV